MTPESRLDSRQRIQEGAVLSLGDLTEAEWRVLKDLLPVEREAGRHRRGWPPEDNRNIINGILWRLRCGTPYDTDAIRADLKRCGIKAVIPPNSNRKVAIRYN